MSRATSTFRFVALLFFVLNFRPAVSMALPATLQLAQNIKSTSISLNATNGITPYCRYEREWYDSDGQDLHIAECEDAIQLLIEEEVAIHGSRSFRWSYPRWSRVDARLTRAKPRRYVSGDCVLSIWMGILGKDVDEDFWTADPGPSGARDTDTADFKSLARQAYKVFDECVLGSGRSQTAQGKAGWLLSGSRHNTVVAVWARAGSLDSWLGPHVIESHLQLPVANESSLATT